MNISINFQQIYKNIQKLSVYNNNGLKYTEHLIISLSKNYRLYNSLLIDSLVK
jgi:DNA polymerase III delta subunit